MPQLPEAFVDAWEPKVEQVTNARHQGMLRAICGESLEHKRFFEQALAGREDLLAVVSMRPPARRHHGQPVVGD